MHVTSNVLVQDPVDAFLLSAAAAEAAALPPPEGGWHLYDLEAINILRAGGGPGTVAVSVHFDGAGGVLPPCAEDQRPAGCVLVCFQTTGSGAAASSQHHRMIQTLGRWLDGRALRWCWQLDGEPWLPGHPASGQPGPAR